MKILAALIMVTALALPTYADSLDTVSNVHRITTRGDLVYIPTGSLKKVGGSEKDPIYDYLGYRGSVEYYLSGLVSIGPAVEYLKKHVFVIEQSYDDDITMINFFVECRFNHQLTDTGANYMVLCLGTGGGNLSANGSSAGGFAIYISTGFDIALSNAMGLDLLYRFQANKFTVNDKIYGFDGSALQAGLNYRFEL